MPKNILVIEDNDNDREIMGKIFKKFGIKKIIFSETGEDGLKKVEEECPDLILVDITLPDIDGFSVCRTIRKKNDNCKVKIIIMTGFIDAVDAVKARKAGADDYCVKTSDFGAVLKVVNDSLRVE